MFANGVPLRERISGLRPPHATATLSLASAGVAAAGAAWYALHRRRTRERRTRRGPSPAADGLKWAADSDTRGRP